MAEAGRGRSAAKTVLYVGCGTPLIIVLIPVVILLAITFFNATAPFDDSDLLIARRDIPAESNAYTYFQMASEKLMWRPGYYSGIEDTNWLSTTGLAIVVSNDAVLEYTAKGLALTECEGPEPDRQTILRMDPGAGTRNVGLFLCLRARVLARQGRYREAMDCAVDALAYARLLVDAPFGLGFSDGPYGIMADAFSEVEEIVNRWPGSYDELDAYMDEIAGLKLDAESITNSLRSDYTWLTIALQEIPSIISPEEFVDLPDLLDPLEGFIFKSEYNVLATRRKFADFYRKELLLVTQPYSASTNFYNEQLPFLYNVDDDIAGILYFFTGNALGLDLYHQVVEWNLGEDALVGMWGLNLQIDALRLRVALRRYNEKYGGLPDDLESLIPEFIDEIPPDPYDWKPLRYSRTNNVIYSVYDNMIDDGGEYWDDDIYYVLPTNTVGTNVWGGV